MKKLLIESLLCLLLVATILAWTLPFYNIVDNSAESYRLLSTLSFTIAGLNSIALIILYRKYINNYYYPKNKRDRGYNITYSDEAKGSSYNINK